MKKKEIKIITDYINHSLKEEQTLPDFGGIFIPSEMGNMLIEYIEYLKNQNEKLEKRIEKLTDDSVKMANNFLEVMFLIRDEEDDL